MKIRVGIIIRVMMIFYRFINNLIFILCCFMFNFMCMRVDVFLLVLLDLFLNLVCFVKFFYYVRDINIGDKVISIIKVIDWEFMELIVI